MTLETTAEEDMQMPVGTRAYGRMGTGLAWVDLAILLAASVTLFLFYPQTLWQAPSGASHVARFAVSYMAVIPLAAAIIYWRLRRVDTAELTATVLIVWSVKMMITVGLYHGLAQGVSAELEPATTPTHLAHSQGRVYHGIPGFVGKRLAGRITLPSARGAARAVVYLQGLSRGKPVAAALRGHGQVLRLERHTMVPALSVAVLDSSLLVSNASDATIVLAGERDGRHVFNIPVVPGTEARAVRLNKSGLICFSARVGPTRGSSWVQVVDHPYFTVADERGNFVLDDVPEGSYELVALGVDAGTRELLSSRSSIDVATAGVVTLGLRSHGHDGAGHHGAGS